MNNKINKQKKGQVALVVLLISAVVMTIGLSISKKTVVDTKVETSQEQLKQAFNAAESGIDYFFGTGSTKFTAVDNKSFADVKVNNIGSGETINYNQVLLANDSVNFWLVAHKDNNDIDYGGYFNGNGLTLCYSSDMGGAIKLDYFYKNGTEYYSKRIGKNLVADYVGGFENIIAPIQASCQSGYRSIDLSSLPLASSGSIPLLLSSKVVGTQGKMYLLGVGSTFPVQGISVSSTGRVGDISTGASVNRQLEVIRIYQVPSFVFEGISTFGSVLSN